MSRFSASPQPPEVPVRTLRLGLVSDTHGLFRPALEESFRGVDAILHAGDVGSLEVLAQLKRLAPVCAVTGNVDVNVPGLDLPAFERYACGEARILITHYVGEPDFHLPPVVKALERVKPLIVVSGHTHRPDLCEREGRLYVNPGSAGPRRFNLPVACGLLTITMQRDQPRFEVRIVDLEAGRVLLQTTWPDTAN